MSTPRARPQVTLTTHVQPSHYEDIARITIAAFDPSWIAERINPPEKRLSLDKRIAANIHTRRLTYASPPPDQHEVIALLNGVPVGLAIWYAPVDRTSTSGLPLTSELTHEAEAKARAEREKTEVVREVEATQDLVWFGLFREEMGRRRREWSQGRGHWYLKVLVTDPAYNGLGIGSQLLAWGAAQAKAEGVPAWLEATDAGRLLYDRRGWKVINWCELPDEKVEGGKLRWPGMAWGEFKDA